MYKSVDGGKTWTHIGLADTQQIGRILVDPRIRTSSSSPRSATATARTRSAASSARETAARPGSACSSRTTNTGAIDLAFDPGNPRTILRRALADAPPAVERLSALERPGQRSLSLDRRRRHVEAGDRGSGLPVREARPHRPRLRAVPIRGRVYAIVRREGGRPVPLGRRRRDAGRARAATRASGSAAGTSAASRSTRRTPTSSTPATSTLYRSTDGGKTFVPFKGAPGGDDYHQLWIDPARPARA